MSIILAIMEIVVSFQRLVLQHGNETNPDHVIFQGPREERERSYRPRVERQHCTVVKICKWSKRKALNR